MMGTKGHEAESWEDIAASGEDIGHDVVIRYLANSETDRAGLLVYHRHSDNAVCGGAVHFDVPGNPAGRPRWQVLSWEPLTLSPSIQDPSCSEGFHGHIVAGAWVPC